MKQHALYAIAVIIFLLLSFYLVFEVRFYSPALELAKLAAVVIVTITVLLKGISRWVNRQGN